MIVTNYDKPTIKDTYLYNIYLMVKQDSKSTSSSNVQQAALNKRNNQRRNRSKASSGIKILIGTSYNQPIDGQQLFSSKDLLDNLRTAVN